VNSTIELAHNMGLHVVAEGVENIEVWKSLQEMGCDYGQGYYMTKPIPACDFEAWYQQWTQVPLIYSTLSPNSIN